MKRTHAVLISLMLAAAVVLGSFAAIRSTQLSTGAAAAPRVDSAQIARQNAALDRAEAALRAQLKKRPPAIKPIQAAAPAAAAPQTVIYKRAPTIVHVLHRHGEHENEGGGDGGGGGFDD
ncbi:MAG TPA: hypothetical protein VI408_01370 [Gaiellaceae bacterium]